MDNINDLPTETETTSTFPIKKVVVGAGLAITAYLAYAIYKNAEEQEFEDFEELETDSTND